jgi:hypothetical protein
MGNCNEDFLEGQSDGINIFWVIPARGSLREGGGSATVE